MPISENRQRLLNLVKRVHGLVENTDIEKHRQSQDQFGALMSRNRDVKITELDMDGMHSEWACVERPHMKKYLILYCHGGGYSTGSCLYGRTLTTKISDATSMDVLSFDYRLAPENPFPAALEDAERAWNFLMHQGYGAKSVILAGDSAGGNLALALLLKLKEEKRILPRAMVLFSPWIDLTCSGKSYETKKDCDPVLSAEYIENMIRNYLEGDVTDERRRNPFVSPVFGDVSGFPPTYIQVGSQEILHSDSEQLYKKLLKAEVPAKMDTYKDMWHVFQMSPFKTAYEAVERAAEFIFSVCRD